MSLVSRSSLRCVLGSLVLILALLLVQSYGDQIYRSPWTFESAYNPGFSPDGSKVAYVGVPRDTEAQCPFNLYVLDVASGESNILIEGTSFNLRPDYSPKTGKILIHGMNNLYLIDPNAEDAQPNLLAEIKPKKLRLSSPTWSPSGEKIAAIYTVSERHEYGILVLDKDGANVNKIVTSDDLEDHVDEFSRLAWTPDGESLVFARLVGKTATRDLSGSMPVVTLDYSKAKRNLWMVKSDGSDLRQLTHDEETMHSLPCMVPGTKKILFLKGPKQLIVSSGEAEIWALDLDTGKQIKIIDSADGDALACSPDATMIAFCRNGRLVIEKTDLQQ